MKTIILQNATGHAKKLLDATAPHHYRSASKLNYSLLTTYRTRNPAKGPSWEKVYMIFDAIKMGYERIVWIDADAFWLGEPIETGQKAPFGMTFHHGWPYNHYNAGVIVVEPDERIPEFLCEWIASDDEGHQWWEQHPMNQLLKSRPTMVYPLGHEWNSVEHSDCHKSRDPKIVAWHGKPELAYDGIMQWIHR